MLLDCWLLYAVCVLQSARIYLPEQSRYMPIRDVVRFLRRFAELDLRLVHKNNEPKNTLHTNGTEKNILKAIALWR